MCPFAVGDRVALHPATDWWRRGARYGTVAKLGKKYIHVQLEVMGAPIKKTVRFYLTTDMLERVG